MEITPLGPINLMLGLKVARDRSRHPLWITQTAYIDSLVERFPGFSSKLAKSAPFPAHHETDGEAMS